MAAALLALSQTAHAHLIQLTPGGIRNTDPRGNNAYQELAHQTFFDDANTFYHGWTSLYGHLNGGTYFTTDFVGQDVTSATVSWDMTGEPHGYWMTLLYVAGLEDGVWWVNFYRVTPDQYFQSGNQIVRAHEGVTISDIAFYGTDHVVPDTGATLGLFLAGLLGLLGAWRLFETHYVNDIVRRTKLQ